MSTARPKRWRKTASPGHCGATTASRSTNSTPTNCASSNRACRASMCAASSCARTVIRAIRSGWCRRLSNCFGARAARSCRLDGQRLTAIATDRGDQPADRAVVCAGAYSKPLAASLGDRVPLETERGYHLMIRDPEIMPRIPTADADGKFVATPMDTGLRFAGTVELAGLDAPPNWQRSQILLAQGRRMLPGLAKEHAEERISMWMGHRPAT